MRRGLLALGVAWAVSACVAAPLPSSLTLPTAADEGPLPAGTLRGQVWRLSGDHLAPDAGARVRVVGTERETTADAQGAYRFDGLAIGRLQVEVVAPDGAAVPVACRLPAAFGVDRVPLVVAPDGASPGQAVLVGTLTDARGAGLPGGTVHCVDSTGGIRDVAADAAGCFVARFVGGKGLSASLTGHGVTPGGLHAETRSLSAIAWPAIGTVAIAVSADLTEPLGQPRPTADETGGAAWNVERLPTRRDEVAVRWRCGAPDVVPTAIAGDRLTVSRPSCDGEVTLLPLGLD